MTVWESAAQIKGNYETLGTLRWSELHTQLNIIKQFPEEIILNRAFFRDSLIIRTTSYKRIDDPNSIPLRHVAVDLMH
jgi:hypothetical protein